jgi:hypothetical protein
METWTRLGRRKAAKAQLSNILDRPESVTLVHYSCESFYDRPTGTSPRVTSIAVRNLESGQTTSFSIHQMAERAHVEASQLEERYDELEKQMLAEFYDYAGRHTNSLWVHWNMRDINYGFQALAHRFRVLGGAPVEIHESKLVDLPRLLIGLYGINYIGHPRLLRLVELNGITRVSFLTGQEEADAFESRQYVKLHQSTLRKVDVLASIVERTADHRLTTNARFRDIYGGYVGWLFEQLRDHPAVTILSILGSLASLLAVSATLWHFIHQK